MANFVQHHYPAWEFTRKESENHKRRRTVKENMRTEADKSRPRNPPMWWADQRLVDQIVPSNQVYPDQLDTFTYRYQVYARPLQTRGELVNKKCPVDYNVKRIAADKVWTPSKQVCAAHWPMKAQKTHYCPINRPEEANEERGKNNNNLTLQEKSLTDHSDSMRRLEPLAGISGNKRTGNEQSKATFDISQNSNRYHRPTRRENRNPREAQSQLGIHSEDVGQQDALNLHSPSPSVAQSYKCNSPTGTPKEFAHNRLPSNVIKNRHLLSPGNDLHNFDILNSGNIVSSCPIAAGPTRVMAINQANRNKDKFNKDSVADLLGNQNNNNNTSAELTGGNETIFIDNLKGVDIGTTGEYIKPRDNRDKPYFMLICVPQALHIAQDCRNNNASDWEYERPKCNPGKYRDAMCRSTTPHQSEEQPHEIKYANRTTPCMELLGHLENRGRPRCCEDKRRSGKPDRGRASENRQKGPAELDAPTIGYMSYKILGGRQYCEPPARDYLSKVKFPPHLEEYREFTRRCPNPSVGRFDRSDPAYEMLAPSQKAANTMSVCRNPFIYAKNPKRYSYKPLFYEPRETDGLKWCLPSAILGPPTSPDQS